MSGVVHGLEVEDEDDDEYEEEDPVAEWFMVSGPEDALVLHDPECVASQDEYGICDCIPVTLQRGAQA